jgi:hypothetical protein
MAMEGEGRPGLVAVELLSGRRVVGPNGDAERSVRFVMERPGGQRRDRRAVRIQDDGPASRRQDARRLIQEAAGVWRMVEDVDEDDVDDLAVGAGRLLRIDDALTPRCWLDVGRDRRRMGGLEPAYARAELDAGPGDVREVRGDLPVPVAVEAPDKRTGVPRGVLPCEGVREGRPAICAGHRQRCPA